MFSVLFMSYVYKFFDKYIPKEVKFVLVPVLTMVIAVPVSLIAIGPLATWLGQIIASAILWIRSKLGWLSVGLMGAWCPIMLLTGTGAGLYPALFQSFAENGYEITAVAAEEKSTGSFQQLRIQSEKTASDLAYFSSLFDGFQEAELFHIYCTMKAEDKEVRLPDAEKPLISVIIRTVGDRLSELQEVFLCLSCQEFQNFSTKLENIMN